MIISVLQEILQESCSCTRRLRQPTQRLRFWRCCDLAWTVWLLSDFSISPPRHCQSDFLQCHWRHERLATQEDPSVDLQVDPSLFQLVWNRASAYGLSVCPQVGLPHWAKRPCPTSLCYGTTSLLPLSLLLCFRIYQRKSFMQNVFWFENTFKNWLWNKKKVVKEIFFVVVNLFLLFEACWIGTAISPLIRKRVEAIRRRRLRFLTDQKISRKRNGSKSQNGGQWWDFALPKSLSFSYHHWSKNLVKTKRDKIGKKDFALRISCNNIVCNFYRWKISWKWKVSLCNRDWDSFKQETW